MHTDYSRTSVTLPEPLLQRAKIAAAKNKTSVNQLLVDGLQKQLTDIAQTKKAGSVPLSTLASSIKVKNPIPAENLREHIDFQF
jgi:hypothetical protein